MRLDVGCGGRASGNVNVDLRVKGNLDRYEDLDVRSIPNFVVCDGLKLPFKDKCFEEVYSAHLVEHFVKPELFVRELLRVCSDRVVLRCPHKFDACFSYVFRRLYRVRDGRCRTHKFGFGCGWFRELGRLLRVGVDVEVSKFRCYPHDLFCLFRLPCEIGVVYRVG